MDLNATTSRIQVVLKLGRARKYVLNLMDVDGAQMALPVASCNKTASASAGTFHVLTNDGKQVCMRFQRNHSMLMMSYSSKQEVSPTLIRWTSN